MSVKKHIPAIRFKGFSEEWAWLELGGLAEFNPKSELPDVFEYVDLESVIGTEMVSHREENKKTAPSRAQRLARQGDLFYQTVRPYQKNNYLFDEPYENFVFSTGYAQLRPNGNGNFLLSLVQNNRFVKSVLDNCTGTSYPAINSNTLADIKVSFPLNNEQTQIGSYFQNLDKLISWHQAKVNKLVNLKKAMLEKMFPKNGADLPEIRFKGFEGVWAEKEVSTLLVERNTQAPKSDAYPLMAFVANVGVAPKGDRYNREFLVNDEENKKYKQTVLGDFIYSSNNLETGSIGLNNYQSASISPVYSIFQPTELGDSDFIGRLLIRKSFINQMVRWRQGVVYGQWRIHESDFLKIEVSFPKLPEQRKIGKYFKSLDKLIHLNQSELDKLNNLKKPV